MNCREHKLVVQTSPRSYGGLTVLVAANVHGVVGLLQQCVNLHQSVAVSKSRPGDLCPMKHGPSGKLCTFRFAVQGLPYLIETQRGGPGSN